MTQHDIVPSHGDVQLACTASSRFDSTNTMPLHPDEQQDIDFGQMLTQLAQGTLAELISGIDDLDSTLAEVDYLLNDFQPPLTGKVRVKFMPIDGLMRPVPIVYRRSKSDNQWKYDKVGRSRLSLRARRAREFWDTRELVAELLGSAAELMQMRSDLLKSMTNFRMSVQSKLKAVKPKHAAALNRARIIICERDDGLHRTFITKHNPPRDV